MKLYREVKCSDRLPDKQKYYYTEIGKIYFTPALRNWRNRPESDYELHPEFWLEPYELPTEEEIEAAADKLKNGILDELEGKLAKKDFIYGVHWLTNLLKGE